MSRRPAVRKVSALPRTVRLSLTADEAASLITVADFYQKNWGPMRGVVGWTTSTEVRGRLRFIAEESTILKKFMQAAYERGFADGKNQATVDFTPRALIALWGRLLASLNSPRGRRKLSQEEVARREGLVVKFQETVASLRIRHAQAVKEEIRTRRTAEQAWMMSALENNAEG